MKKGPEIVRPKPERKQGFEEHLKRFMALRDLHEETRLWKDRADIHVSTRGHRFFALTPLADLHIGGQGCDMEEVAAYLRFIRDKPVSTVLVGDLGDFFSPTKHPEGMMGNVASPDAQALLLRRFMQEYRTKILAVVQDSSHCDWVRQAAGIEVYRWLSEDLDIPLLNNGANLCLTVNDQRYNVTMYHEIARYNSSFNRTHALKRMRELDRPCDVAIGAHRHIGAVEKAVHQEGKPVFAQLGTFKTQDTFGLRRGMVPTPQIFFPTLLFDGTKHNVEVIEDRETAEWFMGMMGTHDARMSTGREMQHDTFRRRGS